MNNIYVLSLQEKLLKEQSETETNAPEQPSSSLVSNHSSLSAAMGGLMPSLDSFLDGGHGLGGDGGGRVSVAHMLRATAPVPVSIATQSHEPSIINQQSLQQVG